MVESAEARRSSSQSTSFTTSWGDCVEGSASPAASHSEDEYAAKAAWTKASSLTAAPRSWLDKEPAS